MFTGALRWGLALVAVGGVTAVVLAQLWFPAHEWRDLPFGSVATVVAAGVAGAVALSVNETLD